MSRRTGAEPDVGDLAILVLAATLAELGDELAAEGFADAADFVDDLAEAADHYAGRKDSRPANGARSSDSSGSTGARLSSAAPDACNARRATCSCRR